MEGSSSKIRRSPSLKDFMQRLGSLTLLPSRRQQGTGHHGAVEAIKLSTGELVAVKTVQSGAKQAERAQLQAERQLLQRLCHTCAISPMQFRHAFIKDTEYAEDPSHTWRVILLMML